MSFEKAPPSASPPGDAEPREMRSSP